MPTFNFSSLHEFIWMSGHGIYVWSCVLITLLILGVLLIHPLMAHKQQIKLLQKRAQWAGTEKSAFDSY